MTRLTSSVHPTRSGLVIAPMDAAWLADWKWVRLRTLLPEPVMFWAAAGVFWAVVAETWRQGGPGPTTTDYMDCDDPQWDRICRALVRADLTDAGGLLTEETWDKWSSGLVAKRSADAERKRLARASASVRARPMDSEGLAGAPAGARYSPSTSPDTDATRDDATSREVREDPTPYFRVAEEVERLTGRPYAIGDPDSKMGMAARDLIAKHGEAGTVLAMRRAAGSVSKQPPTTAQVVFGAGRILDRIPDPAKDEPPPAPAKAYVPPGHQRPSYLVAGCDKDPWHSGDCQRVP